MTFFTSDSLAGGKTSYGAVAGILSLHSTAPRLVGDPVNAQTFDFPVCHAVVDGVTIRDLIQLDGRNMERIIAVAKGLESRGVRFIATSCGLFAPFHKQIADQLDVPFLSSSLQIVSILRSFMARGKTVCVFTAHAGILTEEHLRNSGFSLQDVVIKGMEDVPSSPASSSRAARTSTRPSSSGGAQAAEEVAAAASASIPWCSSVPT